MRTDGTTRHPSTRLGSALLVVTLCACAQPAKAVIQQPTLGAKRCASLGRAIDSTFLVEQAQASLQEPGVPLKPDHFTPVVEKGIELGVLISLVGADARSGVGSGGLVWVDIETGCAIILRPYE